MMCKCVRICTFLGWLHLFIQHQMFGSASMNRIHVQHTRTLGFMCEWFGVGRNSGASDDTHTPTHHDRVEIKIRSLIDVLMMGNSA